MAIRVGRWDCNACGHKGNLGPNLKCEKCNSPRPKNVKFYLSSDSEIVTDKKKIAEAKAGADWVCSYCESHNKATDQKCRSCGATNKASEEHARLKEKSYKGNQAYKNAREPISRQEYLERKQKIITEHKPKQRTPQQIAAIKAKHQQAVKTNKTILKILLGSIGLFFVLFVVTVFIYEPPKPPPPNTNIYDTKVLLVSKNWTSTIKFEIYKEVIEEGWSLPEEARYISEKEEIHHYEKVFDHTETKTRTVSRKVKVGENTYVCGQKDLGNGYFEDEYCTEDVYEYVDEEETYEVDVYRDEPVYQTKYKYYIWRWKPAEYSQKGIGDSVVWKPLPEQSVAKTRNPKKTADYKVFIKAHLGLYYLEKISKEKWESYTAGDSIPAKEARLWGMKFYKNVVY